MAKIYGTGKYPHMPKSESYNESEEMARLLVDMGAAVYGLDELEADMKAFEQEIKGDELHIITQQDLDNNPELAGHVEKDAKEPIIEVEKKEIEIVKEKKETKHNPKKNK